MINWFKKKNNDVKNAEAELQAYQQTNNPFQVMTEPQGGGCCGGETVQLQTVRKAITKVTKNMIIADVIQSHPQAVEIMMKNGLHCFGCGGNMYESIEQGAMGHGMTMIQVNKIVNDINQMIKKAPLAGGGKKELGKNGRKMTKAGAKK